MFAAWRDGVLVNLLNPKIIVFFFAFLPPFIRPENSAPLLQLLILGAIFNTGGTLINFAVSGFAATVRQSLSAHQGLKRLMSRVTATLFFGLALHLVLQRR